MKKTKRACDLSKREVQDFIVYLVVVDPTDQLCFRFIRMIMMILTIGLAIDRAVGLAIGGVVLTKKKVAVGFFGLSLWQAVGGFQKCWIANIGFQIFFSSRYPFHKTKQQNLGNSSVADSLAQIALSQIPSTSYSLLLPASNSKSSYRSFTCPFFVVSYSSSDT